MCPDAIGRFNQHNPMLVSSGVRLAMHAAHRLIQEDGKLALIAACAAGGQVRTGEDWG